MADSPSQNKNMSSRKVEEVFRKVEEEFLKVEGEFYFLAEALGGVRSDTKVAALLPPINTRK